MEATAIQSVEKNITMIALANVQPSNYNPRKNFDEASLAELSESIRQQGVLQPIGVRPIEDNRFEIVFGERRYRSIGRSDKQMCTCRSRGNVTKVLSTRVN